MVLQRVIVTMQKEIDKCEQVGNQYFQVAQEGTAESIAAIMHGHPKWDDRPDGWTDDQLIQWSRGMLYGRGIEMLNVSSYLQVVMQQLSAI